MKIRELTAADQPALLELATAALGEGPQGTRQAEWWNWKHVDNPFGRSLVLGAFEDERLVGLRAFMRWRLVDSSGRRWSCARAVDTATHPSQQGKGIFSKLTLAGLDYLREDGTDIVFNTPNGKSGPGYRKMGWVAVAPLSAGIRPNGLAGALRLAKFAAGRPVQELPLPASADWSNFTLSNWAGLAKAWQSDGLATDWTPESLAWRLASCPVASYHPVVLDGKLLGAVRVHSRKGLREGVLSVAPNISVGTALRALPSEVRERIDYFVWRPTASGARWPDLLRQGALPIPKPVLHLHSREVNSPVPPAEQWHLRFSDLELL
jgi:GNAT superfamily N-acetyltransferase